MAECREQGSTLIFVSHDTEFVEQLLDLGPALCQLPGEQMKDTLDRTERR